MINPVNNVSAMAAYELADLQPTLLSLAQNESAYPCSPLAIEAGRQALQDVHLYSDPDWLALREAIGSVHSLPVDQVLCGAGSMEIIAAIIRAYSQAGDEVLGTAYGYLFVATACQQAGSSYRQAAEPLLRVDIDELLANVNEATRIVFVCNPGNPTGTRITNTELVRLRDSLPADVLLIIDQAYAEFDDQDPRAAFELINRGNTIITRTLSKAYALAGQRVGWGAFPADIAVQVRKLLNPNNVSGVAQAMAVAAMLDQKHMLDLVQKTAKTRRVLTKTLTGFGWKVPESHTNFVLMVLNSVEECRLLDSTLRKAGYLARGMGGYDLAHCLRLTIAKSEDMERVCKTIGSASHD